MSRSVVLLVVTLIAILLLGACGPSARGPIKLSEKDAGRTVELHTGDTLKVTLEENPSTGYRWEVASGDTAILKQVGGREFEPDIIADFFGAFFAGCCGRKVTLRFEASASGQTALKLILQPPVKNVPPLKTFEVTVVVK